ncbi:MAG: DNA-binding protein [Acidobacteriota bacterium]|jgi:ribosomal protein L37AE/L43A|nr:DNA-binding protein [Acidobacteriota bacterium]NLT32325.1 DNA-binding protein [Acidobacteriota bacterium]
MKEMGEGRKIWRCARCDRELVAKKTIFTYMGLTLAHEVEACPGCGKVFVSREMAEGKMAETEQQLEDK